MGRGKSREGGENDLLLHARRRGRRECHHGHPREVAAQLREPAVLWAEVVTPPAEEDAACPISTGRWTRRVRLVRGEGRGVST